MERWISVLRDLSLAEFSVLAIVTVWQWRRSRLRGAGWAAVTFSMLAAVTIAGRIIPHVVEHIPVEWVIKGLLAVLLLVPYALFRFAGTFDPPGAKARWTAVGLTGAVIGWTAVLPYIPQQGAPLEPWFVAYRGSIGVQWIFLFTFVATKLWRAGASGSTPVRRRTRLLAAAAIGMDIPLAIGALGLGASAGVTIVSQSIGVLSAALFALALAPPAPLRLHWRRTETDALRDAVDQLLGATSARQVATGILPHAAAVVGADAAVLVDEHGNVLATYGDELDPNADDPALVRAPFQRGELIVRSSPYAPFFGADEVQLLEGLGRFMDLTLDRCSAAEWEREFIANAAHELRTPLTVLAGLAATLSSWRERMSPDKVGDCLDAMERQGERACRLVNALLDLAQLDRGALRLSVEPVHVAFAANSAVESTPVGPDAWVEVKVPSDLVVAADRGRFDQVLVNLLTNALRHGGSHVVLSARSLGEMIEIAVSDDGPGVDPEMAPRIFQPFARGEEGSGSGLGLAISTRVIEACGGTIHYEPGEPRGAKFVIILPAAIAEADTERPVAAPGGNGNSIAPPSVERLVESLTVPSPQPPRVAAPSS